MGNIYRLGRYVIAQETDGGNYLGLGTRQIKIESTSKWLCILKLCEKAKQGVAYSDLKKIDTSSEQPGTLELLIKHHFIIPYSNDVANSRYSRTGYYYQSIGVNEIEAERRLKNTTVTILGCGGIGNHIAATLASNGVGSLCLIDGDHIELSNLTRQILFSENDIGKRKVDVLAEKLRDRNSDCKIKCIDKYIYTEEELAKLPSSDLIVLSADSEEIVSVINKFCLKRNTPYINVCYMNDIAIWGPFVIPGKTGCHHCGCIRLQMYRKPVDENSREVKIINQDFKSATFPPVNAMASALAAADILRYLVGSDCVSSLDKRIGLHEFTLKFETQDFSKNEECQLCQTLLS